MLEVEVGTESQYYCDSRLNAGIKSWPETRSAVKETRKYLYPRHRIRPTLTGVRSQF